MAENRKQKLPLRMGTRQRIQPVGSVAFSAGNPVSLIYPRVGLGVRTFVSFTGTMTTSNAYVESAKLAFSFVNRFRFYVNQGMASLFDVSGWRTWLLQRPLHGVNYSDTLAAGGGSVYDWPADGAHTNAPVRIMWEIPHSVNDGEQFDLGMINLQAPEIQATLEIRCAALSALPGVTAINGTFAVHYEYYEIPDPNTFMMPALVAIRWLEDNMSIGATGEAVYTLPRQGTLMNLIAELEIDNASSDLWDGWEIRFNKTDTPYAVTRHVQDVLELTRYKALREPGCMVLDFYNGYDRVNTGDVRDCLDTEEITTTEFVLNVNSSATPETSNSRLVVVRRIMQVLA